MKFTDYSLSRSVWFSVIGGRGYLAHSVVRDLVKCAIAKEKEGYENLLKIIRRYE